MSTQESAPPPHYIPPAYDSLPWATRIRDHPNSAEPLEAITKRLGCYSPGVEPPKWDEAAVKAAKAREQKAWEREAARERPAEEVACDWSDCKEEAAFIWVRSAKELKQKGRSAIRMLPQFKCCERHRTEWRVWARIGEEPGAAPIVEAAKATTPKRKHCKTCTCGEGEGRR